MERKEIQAWIKDNFRMIVNAGSMVGTMALTAFVGLGYWWLAARYYSVTEVGIASTAIATMLLLGEVGVFGFSSFLIGEISRDSLHAASLIVTSALVVTLTGGTLGLLFAGIAPLLSDNLAAIGGDIGRICLFALGVSVTSISLVVDYSTIGLNHGEYQLWRNAAFSLLKLFILWMFALWWGTHTGMNIYATWTLGAIMSLALGVGVAVLRGGLTAGDLRPDFSRVRGLHGTVFAHHVLNLAVIGPGMLLPMLTTVLLSADVTGSFYIAWMFNSFILIFPTALATSLYGAAVKDPASMVSRLRLSLLISITVGICANLTFLIVAGPILSIFGHEYADQANRVLPLMGLVVFPHTVLIHYVAISRIRDTVKQAAWMMLLGSVVQIGGVIIGAQLNGASGLVIGLVVALCMIAMPTAPVVYRATRKIG